MAYTVSWSVTVEREFLLLRGGLGFVLSCMDYLLSRSVAWLVTELLLVSEDLQRARAWPCLRAGACSDVGACTEMLQYVTTVELELVTMSWSS